MDNGFIIEGFDDFEELLQEMTITEADEKKAMKNAIKVIENEIVKNTPVETGNMAKKIKSTVKKENFATVGEVKLGAWYTIFEEFGTSQNKKNVGFAEKSIRNKENEAISILSKELLDKVN